MSIPTKEQLAEEMMSTDWDTLSPVMQQIAINRHFLRRRCLLEDEHLTKYIYHAYIDQSKSYICQVLPNYQVSDERLQECQIELEVLGEYRLKTWETYGDKSWPKLQAQ